MRGLGSILGIVMVLGVAAPPVDALEQRDLVFRLRGPYNFQYFRHHPEDFQLGAVAHWAHGWQHDLILITPRERTLEADARFYRDFERLFADPPRTEPHQDYVGPRMARLAWKVMRTIDWAHMLHEQLYDIMTDPRIPPAEKKRWIDRAVRYYLSEDEIAFSVAPAEVVLKRAGLNQAPWLHDYMMAWPRAAALFFAFHWWHMVVYEAQLLYPELQPQQEALRKIVLDLFANQVLKTPPNRMLFTRETAPRWARAYPEAANIFDNLHMFHHLVYSVLQSDRVPDKRAELYRIVELMRNRPGDRELAGDFTVPHPEMDPLVYYDWMHEGPGVEGQVLPEMHMPMGHGPAETLPPPSGGAGHEGMH